MTRQETTSNRLSDKFAIGLGLATAGLGLAGLVETFLPFPSLPRVVAWGFIALGFALASSGSAVIGAGWGRSKPSLIGAGIAVVLGAGTLVHYITGWSLPFSELGGTRMAPTAEEANRTSRMAMPP